MIRHVATRRADRVTDAVGCSRAFGSVFVLSGLTALALAVFGNAGMEEAGIGSRLVVAVIGAAHLGGGLALWGARWSGATIRRRGVEWAERRPFRPTRSRSLTPSEVDRVLVEEGKDDDGDATYRVVLALTSGERLPLTLQASPMASVVEGAAAAVARRLGIPEQLG